MGLFLGIVEKYNPNKGHITVKLNEQISIGDTISLQNETGSYTISELLKKDKNITETNIRDTVTVGRFLVIGKKVLFALILVCLFLL